MWSFIVLLPSAVRAQISGEGFQRQTQQHNVERFHRTDTWWCTTSFKWPIIHHNENLHLWLVNHKRLSERVAVCKQTDQRRQKCLLRPYSMFVCTLLKEERNVYLSVCASMVWTLYDWGYSCFLLSLLAHLVRAAFFLLFWGEKYQQGDWNKMQICFSDTWNVFN